MIGAAGELHVFEHLSALDIPGFSQENWRSRIKGYVSVLDDYSDLHHFPDQETADIVCRDDTGNLMKFLLEHSSYNYPDWMRALFPSPGQQTEFLIEVKATPLRCSTPLFLSRNQYYLMDRHAINPGAESPATSVYVLVRVYNLFSDDVEMEVYFNPWHLRDVLEFKAEEWTVIARKPKWGGSLASSLVAKIGKS